MTPRELVLGALDRMIESVQDEMKQEDHGNHMTLAYLKGELKGLMASRAYAANAIPSAPPEVDAMAVVRKHMRHVDLSPGVGKEVQDYAIAVCEDILADLSTSSPQKTIEGSR